MKAPQSIGRDAGAAGRPTVCATPLPSRRANLKAALRRIRDYKYPGAYRSEQGRWYATAMACKSIAHEAIDADAR